MPLLSCFPHYFSVEQAATNSTPLWTVYTSMGIAVVSACAACVSAWFVWKGVSSWQHQLKGAARLEVARKLILAVYKLKNSFHYARDKLHTFQPVTHDSKGNELPPDEANHQGRMKDMWEKGKGVYEASTEAEALIYEGKFLFGVDLDVKYKPINELVQQLLKSSSIYRMESNHQRQHSDSFFSTDTYKQARSFLYWEKGSSNKLGSFRQAGQRA